MKLRHNFFIKIYTAIVLELRDELINIVARMLRCSVIFNERPALWSSFRVSGNAESVFLVLVNVVMAQDSP